MNKNQGMVSCAVGCWLVTVLGGVLAAVLLGVLGTWTFVQAVFAGIVIAGIAGALLSWIMCKPLPPLGKAHAGETSDPAKIKAEAARAEAQARSAEAAAAATASDPGTAAVASAPATAKPAAKAKEPKPAAKAKPAQKAKPAADAVPAEAGAGKKPKTMSAAREGGPDDLKQIKGVGPKLEALLHSMGFYHFDQIAAWGADEIAWVDQNLEGFKGRVSRDGWVSQAKTLAEGGTTEFSKKVKKGDVY